MGNRQSHSGVAWTMESFGGNSPLGQWNPGLKLAVAAALVFCCAWLKTPVGSLGLFAAMTAVILGPGRVPGGFYRRLLVVPGVFLLLSTLTMAVDFSRQRLGLWQLAVGKGYLCITPEGLTEGVTLAAVGLASVSVLYAFALSTPAGELAQVLGKLRCPKVVVELTYLLYRFLFVLLDSWERMDTAARSRLGDRDFPAKLRTAGGVMTGLLVLAFRRAEAAYDAMEARCWDGELNFAEQEKPITTRQGLLGAGGLAGMVLMLLISRGMGW